MLVRVDLWNLEEIDTIILQSEVLIIMSRGPLSADTALWRCRCQCQCIMIKTLYIKPWILKILTYLPFIRTSVDHELFEDIAKNFGGFW